MSCNAKSAHRESANRYFSFLHASLSLQPIVMPKKTLILDQGGIASALARIADEIAARRHSGEEMVLVGIQRGGVHLAERLKKMLHERGLPALPVGRLDVNMHRDDLGRRAAPNMHPTVIPFDLNGKAVILVDDVLFRGRTVRAAMDSLNDFGRPQRIQLAVLIDRGHRELPIHADFVGTKILTDPEDVVDVRLMEDGEQEAVYLVNA